MNSEKRKILLIENQKFQFDKIVPYLNKYEVFPKKTDFVTFIDNVRVWVNKQYKKKYRDTALSNINDVINNNKIELIIMDHILGGACDCLTGIELAEEINNVREDGKWIPVLFISKTEHTEENRILQYDNYRKKYKEDIYTNWVHKGYFGHEILEPDYFASKVLPEINTLRNASEENTFWSKLDMVKNLTFPDNQKEKFNELVRIRENIKYENLSDEFKKHIEKVYTSSNKIIELNCKILKNAK